jgi:glycosyltransferase involved in cell wall biosynthesis
MKLCFVIATLKAGGAQRVLTLLANAFAAKGVEVTVLTFDAPTIPPFFALSQQIAVRHLPIDGYSANFLQSIANTFRRWHIIRDTLRDIAPDAVISFVDTTNIRIVASSLMTGLRVIVAERSDPARHALPPSWRILRNLLYPFADVVVVQTEELLRRLPPTYRARARRIPNPVPVPTDTPASRERPGTTILGMGRLITSKGFDVLIRAFARASKAQPEWRLRIVGDGPERSRLESLAGECGVRSRVHFDGMVRDVATPLSEADIFVFASRYEGFPNALTEAMAHGCAVVSTDCPCGPAEIIRDGVDGFLVPVDDIKAMSGAMLRLMSNAQERRRLAERAREVCDRFSLERILELWQETL